MAYERVTFSPDHYFDALRHGITWREMQSNIENRAAPLGNRLKDYVLGSLAAGSLDEILMEARDLKEYRVAFISFVMDEMRKEHKARTANPTPNETNDPISDETPLEESK